MLDRKSLETNLIYLYVTQSGPERDRSAKASFYAELVGCDLSSAETYIEEALGSYQPTNMALNWLKCIPELSPLANFAIRLTACDVVNPIEHRHAEAVARYLDADKVVGFIEQFRDYLDGRSAHKTYGNLPIAFDDAGAFAVGVSREQSMSLHQLQLDNVLDEIIKEIINVATGKV